AENRTLFSNASVGEMGPDAVGEELVAGRIEVKPVRHEKLGTRVSIGAQRDGVGLDIFQMRRLADVSLNQRIDRLLLVRLLPARDARAEGDENDLGLGQL